MAKRRYGKDITHIKGGVTLHTPDGKVLSFKSSREAQAYFNKHYSNYEMEDYGSSGTTQKKRKNTRNTRNTQSKNKSTQQQQTKPVKKQNTSTQNTKSKQTSKPNSNTKPITQPTTQSNPQHTSNTEQKPKLQESTTYWNNLLHSVDYTFGSGNPVWGNKRVSNFQKAYDENPNFMDNYGIGSVMEGLNVMSGGTLNRLSPTQNMRLLYDLMVGNPVFLKNGQLGGSWWGNNGIVSDEFAEEHPYLAATANGIIDLGVAGVRPRNFNSGQRFNINDPQNWSQQGAESVVRMGENYVDKIPVRGSYTKTGMGFDVRKKLFANDVPSHVPYSYEGYTKAGNKYYPIYRQQRVQPVAQSEGVEALNSISKDLNANGWKTRVTETSQGHLLEGSNGSHTIGDVWSDQNIGMLNGKPVTYDAMFGQGMSYPSYWFKSNFQFNTTPGLTSVGAGINGQNNQNN